MLAHAPLKCNLATICRGTRGILRENEQGRDVTEQIYKHNLLAREVVRSRGSVVDFNFN